MECTQCGANISDSTKFCPECGNQTNTIRLPTDKNAKKYINSFTIVLIMIIILSLAGNGYLMFENTKKQASIEQIQEKLNEYQIQMTKLVDAIEQYENQNAGAKTYAAIKAWWDAIKGLTKDICNYGVELQDEYGECFDEEEN